MNQETNNTGAAPATQSQPANTQGQAEKTFSQAELDAIIADRLSRERAKYSDYDAIKDKAAKYDAAEEANKSELQKAQEAATKAQAELDKLKAANAARDLRDKVASETKVPAALLTAETEEGMRAQAKAILDFAKPGSYPAIKDGGEPKHPAGNGSTRDQFAEWMASLGK